MNGFATATIFQAVDKFTPVIARARGSVDKFSAGAKAALKSVVPESSRLGQSFSGIAKGVALGNLMSKGVSSAARAARSVVMSVPEFAGRADEIGKTSARLGMATDALQRYRYAAAQSNVASGTLDSAFAQLSAKMGNGSLVSAVGKIDASLAAQVKQAKTADEAFRMIAASADGYGDASKRAALLTGVFGRAGNQLSPMLEGLGEQMEAAGRRGNIIPPESIAMAARFGTAMTDAKMAAQHFGDVIRERVLRYLTPLIEKALEWAEANREVIASKINGFIDKFAGAVRTAVPFVTALVQAAQRFGPAVLGAAAAYKIFAAASRAAAAAQKAMAAAAVTSTAATTASTAATVTFASAMKALNAAMRANMIGLIVTGAALLIAGFIMLAGKVGGVKEAFIVLGQTLMKYILTPFNTLLSVVQAVLSAMGKIPGMEWAQSAAAGLESFQNGMNRLLTGSESTLLNAGPGFITEPYRRKRDAETARREAAAAAADEKDGTGESILEQLKKMGGLMEDEIDAIEGLHERPGSSPAKLRWGAMGVEDYFETARRGI